MLKVICLIALSFPLHAASYYVSSSGSDSNNGSQTTPWLTLQHSVSSVNCGDTINVVANGNWVAGDANLPNLPCSAKIIVQSSRISNFAPVGYRTNPVNDASSYGKLSFTTQGVSVTPAVWTYNQYFSYASVSFEPSTGWVTIAGVNGLTSPNFANGSQVELEAAAEGSSYGGQVFPVILAPGGLSFLTHYFAVSCGAGPVGSQGYPQTCGQPNSRFKLALTSGGTPVTISSCGSYCANTVVVDPSGACTTGQIQYNTTDSKPWGCPGGTWVQSSIFQFAGVPAAVDLAANTITIPVNYGPGSLANTNSVAFSSAGLKEFGTNPTPLQLDKTYYIQNLSGSTFKLSTDAAGTHIVTLTSVGTGMTSMATTAVASNWLWDGLEMAPNGASQPFYLFRIGNGVETSLAGMPSHFEVSRSYLHDNPPTQSLTHAIFENSTYFSIHDSWVIGATLGEAQAIGGIASPGPTYIVNNFLEAAGEVTLYGGAISPYSPANANKLFLGNYFYKAPSMKVSTGTVVASGPCLYDATDTLHAGGEWYRDIMAGQNYQCGSDFLWHTTATALPASPIIKDMTEHKNGSHIFYIWNVYNYSISQDQSGQLWNNSMEYGSGPGMANDNILVMNNAGFNSFTFNSRTSQCFPAIAACPILPGNHTTKNNLLVLNPLVCGTSMSPGCGFSSASYSATTGGNAPYFNDDLWDHNTIWSPNVWPFSNMGPMSATSPTGGCPPFTPLPVNRVTFRNNLMVGDFSGACQGAGGLLTTYFSNSTLTNNALRDPNTPGEGAFPCCGGYPSGNFGTGNSWTNGFFPASNTVMGFVSGTGGITGNYRLSLTSPYSAGCSSGCSAAATDGTDMGGDIDLIMMGVNGALLGTPPTPVDMHLVIAAGSTNLVMRYTAPSSSVCTLSLYSGARVPLNLIGSAVPDSAATSVSVGQFRELLFSGLSPSTTANYSLNCGVTDSIVGALSTKASGSGSYPYQFQNAVATAYNVCNNAGMSSGCTNYPAAVNQNILVPTNTVVYAQAVGSAEIHILAPR